MGVWLKFSLERGLLLDRREGAYLRSLQARFLPVPRQISECAGTIEIIIYHTYI